MSGANLCGASLALADLRGTKFFYSILNDHTLLLNCKVDKYTDFRGVGLSNVLIDPATRALLEYNIRRMNWEDWYQNHKFLRYPVWFFWWLSDYGHSTLRIILSFICSALFFAVLYTILPGVMAGISDGSFMNNLYLSVTAMTSLGLSVGVIGPGCLPRYVALMLQYIIGYAILGALVTRFGILFTASGPSGDFTKSNKQTNRK